MASKESNNPSGKTPQIRKRKWKTSMPIESLTKRTTYSSFDSKIKKLGRTTEEINILNLPNEILNKVLMYLEAKEIGRAAATCHHLNNIVNENLFWKKIFNAKFSKFSSTNDAITSYRGSWKRQFGINYTKCISYQLIGNARKVSILGKIKDISSAFGLKKLCSSRDHVFVLDLANCLHVYRSRVERLPASHDHIFKKVEWHKDFATNVVDVTSDPRYDNNHRRYVYVLTQSEAMRNRRSQRNSNLINFGRNSIGEITSGDKIDVFDERTCRRVFNMTFDPEMRFVSMKLTSATPNQKTLYILTDSGKVYSLHLFESSLLNLGAEGMQVTLKSASKSIGEKVQQVEASVGLVSFITEKHKLFVVAQKRSEFADIFGAEVPSRICIPHPVSHVAKVMTCSIGDRHLGFIDEYNRVYLLGSNRYGQLGTGDRMDRHSPVQVLCQQKARLIYCGMNHTMVVVETDEGCHVLGAGSGNNGKLPGKVRGSVVFTKLDIKVPWSVRQIDTHKEAIFLLGCHDSDNQLKFKKRTSLRNDLYLQSLAFKSQHELLFELRKSENMTQKLKIIEVMIEHLKKGDTVRKLDLAVENSASTSSTLNDQQTSESQSNCQALDISDPVWRQQHIDNIHILHSAIEQVRQQAEQSELDDLIRRNQPIE